MSRLLAALVFSFTCLLSLWPNAANSAPISAAGHTCVLTIVGGVQCWGLNSNGQLGDGTTTQRSTPVPVSGLNSGVQAIAVGGDNNGYHSCALTTSGAVLCWGRNGSGQLGDGTYTDRLTPVAVTGLGSGVQAIAVGGSHSCALTSGGAVKCWGSNYYGQLGDGTNTDRLTPVVVSGLSGGVQALATGTFHSCALTTAGGVQCWGQNQSGQLGDGNSGYGIARSIPAEVTGLSSGVQALAGGFYHSCALMISGGVQCWGENNSGQLGDGTYTRGLTPVAVTGLSSGGQEIAAGGYNSCVLMTSGGVKCWGHNGSGQLGDGTTTQRNTPVSVNGLSSGVQAIAVGEFHSCALMTVKTVKCWGYNSYGQLGDGTVTDSVTPVPVVGLKSDSDGDGVIDEVDAFPFDASETVDTDGDGIGNNADRDDDNDGIIDGILITAAINHTCALDAGGVHCWGENVSGVTTVPTLLHPVAVSTAIAHTCAITDTGVQCWGDNTYGQTMVPALIQPVAVSAGGHHTCALDSTGAHCWGAGMTNARTFLEYGESIVPPLSNPVALSAGGYHTCALDSAGVHCWGAGVTNTGTWPEYGQAIVPSLSNPVAVSSGAEHTCALDDTGVHCWGRNEWGQTSVPSLSHPRAVSAGWNDTCAIDDTGVHCWGDNSSGQTVVPALVNPVAVSAGDQHACAIDDTGVHCWGSGYSNQSMVPALSGGDNCRLVANADQKDTDNDGIGDACDSDIDGDGIDNNVDPDIDGDGVANAQDAFPLDDFESIDTDNDGIGNNADPDDDNDSIVDKSSISVGSGHACALDNNGVHCWGVNDHGEISVPDLVNPVAVSAGDRYTCALDVNGVHCWGDNFWGQSSVPSLVEPVAVSAGTFHTCALDTNGVHCWGNNESGQSTVPKLLHPVAVSVGYHHTCALDDTGVHCWGDNTYGQTAVPALVNPVSVSAGVAHSCALDANGVHCWGDNSQGQISVPPLTHPVAISSGYFHACAIDNTGVKCWGDSTDGKTMAPTLNHPVVVSAGAWFTCALDINGVHCWGSDQTELALAPSDNCPMVANANQLDTDGDGIGDACDPTPHGDTDGDGIDNAVDNCPLVANANQKDTDSDGIGDACDPTPNGDADGDGVDNLKDNCPTIVNADQKDTDGDGKGDVCDPTPNGDTDGDGVDNAIDNCPLVANANQKDTDGDGLGDVCDSDADNDGVPNNMDTFPLDATESVDTDGDGIGNNADADDDNDGVPDVADAFPLNPTESFDTDSDGIGDNTDNCRLIANADQLDTDGDGQGNACDTDQDNDTVLDTADNCPLVANVNQLDTDGDGQGDACDPDDDNDGVPDIADAFPLNAAASVDADHDGLPDAWNPGCDTTCQAGSGLVLDSITWSLALGSDHTCTLTSGGAVFCWGLNDYGQLGDNSVVNKSIPVAVTGLGSGVKAIAAGIMSKHTCAITSTGGALCWGANGGGQLGTGVIDQDDPYAKLTPVAVSGLSSGVTAIAVGWSHTCALNSAGGVQCWGAAEFGQLGNGTAGSELTPMPVAGLESGVTAITAGWHHTCALTNAGAVLCWGDNSYGQLGDGTVGVERFTPVAVSGLSSGIVAIEAGFNYTCAITNAGALLCWGEGQGGQLGNGTTDIYRLTPTPVNGLSSGVMAVTAGYYHTCALMTGGGVKCWGDNSSGQLGDNSTEPKLAPVDVTGLSSGIVAIEAGFSHTCAIASVGSVQCWGGNYSGELGNGYTNENPPYGEAAPVWVVGFTNDPVNDADGDGINNLTDNCPLKANANQLDTDHDGIGDVCDTTPNGDADNDGVDDLSDNCPLNANPDQLDSEGDGVGDACDPDDDNDGVPDVADAFPFNVTESVDTDADGIGNNADPDDDNDGVPDFSSNPIHATAIAVGAYHACAVTAGNVQCWGNNDYGQTTVPILVNPTAVSAGFEHTCALDVTGVHCWGRGIDGNSVPALDHPVAVTSGGEHACALDATGVHCWGRNIEGQTDVPPLVNPVAVSAGYFHTCALDDTGVHCWGANSSDYNTGQTIVPALSNPVAVFSGGYHTCALDDAGLHCWGNTGGYYNFGQSNPPALVNPSAVALGGFHTCAIDDAGLHCWGYNDAGQTDVPSLQHPVAVSANRFNTCAVDDTGVHCWGYTGQTDVPTVPLDNCRLVANPDQKDSDGDGIGDACDTDNDNDGIADADEIALGNDPLNNLDPPRAAISSRFILGIDNHDAGAAAYSALWNRADGVFDVAGTCPNCVAPGYFDFTMTASADICGVNSTGMGCLWWIMDSGPVEWMELLPVQVAGQTINPIHDWDGYLKYVDQASALHYLAKDAFRISGDHVTHACFASKTMGVYCWANHSGTDIVSGNIPASLRDVSTVKDVAVGDNHACAINNTAVECWGEALSSKTSVPAVVNAPTQLAAGANHTCAINANGTVSCWGDNSNGQLGDGDADGFVDGVSNALRITAGANHSCAVTGSYSTPSSLRVSCWGSNSAGQTSVPTDLTDGVASPVSVTAAGDETCAIKAGQNVAAAAMECWPVGVVP